MTAPAALDERLPVSVIVPAFNRAGTLPRALGSVAGQQARPAEVIVVDDCSSDDTAAVAEALGARVVRHEVNRGAAAARNTAIAAATQPWIAPLDSDDEWLPHHLRLLWAWRRGRVLVAGSALGIGGDGPDRLHGAVAGRRIELRWPPDVLYPENPIPASGVLVSRDAVEAAGGYDPRLRLSEDLDLWIRVLELGAGVCLPEVIALYHRHADQKTRDDDAAEAGRAAIFNSYHGRPWWSWRLAERRQSIHAWEDLYAAASSRRPRAALPGLRWMLRRPLRAVSALRVGAWLLCKRRRSSALARDGGPSVALLPGAPALAGESARAVPAGAVSDLRDRGPLRLARRLVAGPPGLALAGRRWAAALAWALGVPTTRRASELARRRALG
jgi:glycosyltransferase involved in cell wall biosynthesis